MLKKYMLMYYYSLLYLGTNEIGPVHNIELLFALSFLLFSNLLNSLLFSDMAVIVQFLQESSSKL